MKTPVIRKPRDRPTIDDLDSRIGSLDRDLVALRVFLNEAADDDHDSLVDAARDVAAKVERLEAENEDLRNRLDQLGDIGAEKTTKEQKVAAIVTYAHQSRRDGQDAVTVLPKHIKGLVDVSRRYAYDLVDSMVEEFDWAHDPSEVRQYGSLEKDTPQKGVCIDFEGVHGEPCPVNKFTTQPTAVGVAD